MLKGVTRSVSPMMCNVGSGKRWSAWGDFHGRKRSISSVTCGMEQGVGNMFFTNQLMQARKENFNILPYLLPQIQLTFCEPNFYIQKVVSQAFSQAASPLVGFLRVPPFFLGDHLLVKQRGWPCYTIAPPTKTPHPWWIWGNFVGILRMSAKSPKIWGPWPNLIWAIHEIYP